MPSARTPSRVTIPCRSSSSSASARRSAAPAKSRSVRDQRPCVAVAAVARVREKRLGLRSGFGTPYRRPARSGVQASFVTSPAQTRSQSAGRASSSVSPPASSRSDQNIAPPARAARSRPCASSSGDGAPAGAPRTEASSRKYRTTRSSPAPTHTTSPLAQSASSCSGRYPGTRRGSTSLSQSDTGSASPWSGTSASRRVARRSIPCQEGRKRASASLSTGSTSRRRAARDARRRRRRTSGSHHSRSLPPGRSSPRRSSSSRSSSASTADTSRPKRSFASAVVNGPRPLPKRRTSRRSESGPPSR